MVVVVEVVEVVIAVVVVVVVVQDNGVLGLRQDET